MAALLYDCIIMWLYFYMSVLLYGSITVVRLHYSYFTLLFCDMNPWVILISVRTIKPFQSAHFFVSVNWIFLWRRKWSIVFNAFFPKFLIMGPYRIPDDSSLCWYFYYYLLYSFCSCNNWPVKYYFLIANNHKIFCANF